MISISKWTVIPAIALASAVLVIQSGSSAKLASLATPRERVAFSHTLPPLDGKSLRATVVEVSYGPGESSKPHSHPCPVIGYVLSGRIRSQVKGQPASTYNAGESFYEAPNSVHLVSANASKTLPAKFLAYFVCDSDAPLSSPVSASNPKGGN